MHGGVRHCVWAELLQPASHFIAREAGWERNVLGRWRGHNSTSYFVSSLRIDFNSCRRFGVVFGYVILRSPSESKTIWETIKRAFSLSSAGTNFQGGRWG